MSLPDSYRKHASSGRGGNFQAAGRFSAGSATPIDPWSHAGNTMYSGIVTLDLECKEDLPEQRARNVNNANPKIPDETMGTLVGAQYLSILPDEILMQANGIPGEDGKKSALFVFSATNGICIPPTAYTQEDLEAMVRFAGVSKITYSYLPGAASQTGMTSVIRGACTTQNRGSTTFHFGDIVRMRLYNKDSAKRADELAGHQVMMNTDKNKLQAYLELASHESVRLYAQEAVTRFMKSNPAGSGRQNKHLVDLSPESQTPNMQATSLDRLFHMLYSSGAAKQAFLAVATLLQAGIISLNVGEVTNPIDPGIDFLNALDKDRTEDDWTETAFVGDMGGGWQAPADQASRKAANWGALKTFAAMLGLVSVPGVSASPGLVNLLALRAARGDMTTSESAADYIRYGLDKMIPPGLRQRRQEKQLMNLQNNHSRSMYRAYYFAHYHAHHNIIGMVLSPASPGVRMDLLP